MTELAPDLKGKAELLQKREAEIAGQLRRISAQFKEYTTDTIEDGEASQRPLDRELRLKDELASCIEQMGQLYEEQYRRDMGKS